MTASEECNNCIEVLMTFYVKPFMNLGLGVVEFSACVSTLYNFVREMKVVSQ